MTTFAARWRALMTRNTIHCGLATLALLTAGVLLAGCSSSRPAVDAASLTPPFLETPIAPRPPATAARSHGRPVQVQDDGGRPAADRRRPVPHDLARRERHGHAAVEVPADRR